MPGFQKRIAKWKNSARLTDLSDEFEELASGLTGKPSVEEVIPDFLLFNNDVNILHFYSRYRIYSGTFNLHFLSSIPYILEEECRLGSALLQYLLMESRSKNRVATLQTIGNAEGVIARTIADLGNGKISTLTNSPTASNMHEFYSRHVKDSFFHLGPFFEITRKMLSENKIFSNFSHGFDVIYEDTEFQMYGPDREEQISFSLRNMKKDGIFLCLEKCIHTDKKEYFKRENQKNIMFKEKFYSKQQLERKKIILEKMKPGQVTLRKLNRAIKNNLRYTKLIWNSGNFYIIAGSNNYDKLESFVNLLGPACIKPEFVYERIPYDL